MVSCNRTKASAGNGTAAVSETAAVATTEDGSGAKKLTAEEVKKIKVW